MKTFILGVAAAGLIAGAASAADRPGWGHDYGAAPHKWHNGERMGYNDWHGARAIDWRARHLRQPPAGYEWREVNGQLILAAVATGVIATIIADTGG